MNNYNIRQDRPRLSSEEIAQQKDFNSLLNDYRIMKKPFYKNPWFFGVTGMATVGLLIGTTYSFTDSPSGLPELAAVTESAPPPEGKPKTVYLASLETPLEMDKKVRHPKKKKEIKLKKNILHDKTSTLNNTTISQTEKGAIAPSLADDKLVTATKVEKKAVSKPSGLANHPKILGKIGGNLKMSEIDNNVSISTDSDIPIVGFELHITTEFGSKIFVSNSNKLTPEMVDALKDNQVNNEVYFEQIKGRVNDQMTIGLQPLKYTLVK